jgi:hypothetical protein
MLFDEEASRLLTFMEDSSTERWSTVEYNNATRMWEVEKCGEVLYSHPLRSDCIKWEHEEYERRARA